MTWVVSAAVVGGEFAMLVTTSLAAVGSVGEFSVCGERIDVVASIPCNHGFKSYSESVSRATTGSSGREVL